MTAMMHARAADTVQKIDRLVAAGCVIMLYARRVPSPVVTLAVDPCDGNGQRYYDGGTLDGALAQLTDAELAKYERGGRA